MKILQLILAFSLICSSAFATITALPDGTKCDWSKVIHNADGTLTYPANLHICVGKLVQDNATKAQQIVDLNKSVDLYRLSIQTDEQRIQNLMMTLANVQTKIQDASDLQSKNQILYFGLGVLTTGLAAYSAAKLSGH